LDPLAIGFANEPFTLVLPEDSEDKPEKQKYLRVINLRAELTESSEKKVGRKGKLKFVQGADVLEFL
jgi:hypothetical protein